MLFVGDGLVGKGVGGSKVGEGVGGVAVGIAMGDPPVDGTVVPCTGGGETVGWVVGTTALCASVGTAVDSSF